MWGIIIAAVSGALMSIQGVFNSEVTKQTSVWLAASFVQITAFVVCVAVHYWKGRHSRQFVAGIAAVYAAWRSDWRLYYLYCYFEYQCDWAGEVGDVYCIGTDARILSH